MKHTYYTPPRGMFGIECHKRAPWWRRLLRAIVRWL